MLSRGLLICQKNRINRHNLHLSYPVPTWGRRDTGVGNQAILSFPGTSRIDDIADSRCGSIGKVSPLISHFPVVTNRYYVILVVALE